MQYMRNIYVAVESSKDTCRIHPIHYRSDIKIQKYKKSISYDPNTTVRKVKINFVKGAALRF